MRAPGQDVKWVNAGDDAGALHALLQRIPATLPVDTVDVLWIFPTRRAGNGESTVVVVAAFTEEAARRRVHTAHFRVTRNNRGMARVEEQLDEHALAPLEALPRVVDGVVRRMAEDVGDAPPREVVLAGGWAAWTELIVELGGEPPAEPGTENGEEPPPAGDDAGDPRRGAEGAAAG